MFALVGFLMIAILVVALIKFKVLPISFFATVPFVAAFALGFGVTEVFTMTAKGIIGVLPTACLFVGSITYFGIMSDAGLFDRPVNWLAKHVRPSVFSVLCTTVLIAMISHLDGSGTTTIMITVPAMLPILKKFNVRKLPVAFMLMMTISVMNLLPWGGPLGRAAVVVGVETTDLWKAVLPVQIFGVVLLFATAFLLAKSEEKHGYVAKLTDVQEDEAVAAAKNELARPKLFWANLALTVIVIVLLFMGCPAFLPFLIGIAIGLPMNYGKLGDRGMTKRIAAHAGDVVPMILTIIGAGIFLGVLQSGIIDAMAGAIVSIIPSFLGKWLHTIMGVLAIPMSLVMDADTMNLGILPFISEVGATYGIPAIRTALAIAIGHNTGIGFCMTSASVYFGLGLIGLEYGEAIKYSFLKALAFGFCMVLFGAVIGVL